MSKVTKVVERHEDSSIVEVQVTVRTEIREGRDVPSMEYNGVQITDEDFIGAVHMALDGDKIVQQEMSRICGD